jgi:predicted acetyltransferase
VSLTTPEPLPTRLVDLSIEDAERVNVLEDLVWFEVPPGLTAQEVVETLDWSRSRGVEITGEPPLGTPGDSPAPLVGVYSAFDMRVTVPGPHAALTRLPMSGLTWVGVHPDRRRRGILRQMMTDHLHGLHDSGEAAIAGLHAAEVGIYGRFGYGTASLDVALTLSRATDLTVGEDLDAAAKEVATHFVAVDSDEASAALHRAHLGAAELTLGTVTRGEDVARSWFRDHPSVRQEKEPLQVMFAQRGGQLTGYAVFRRISKWSDDNQPDGEVGVRELGANDPASLLALARRMLDFDLTAKVKFWSRSTDDPIMWWAGGPRSAGLKASDALWIRLVDVDKALTARGYAGPVDVVLEVLDDLCPWNARRWRLTAGDDGVGRCLPTEDEPEVRVPVEALGAAYLGGRSIASQSVAGLVTELRPGAVHELSRAMRADVEPVGAIGF